MVRRVFFGIVFCLVPGFSFAVSDDYQVRLLVGSDTTPPTNPGIVSAIPIAPTQIDITWSVAIDDVSLAGYRLYRDGLPIATTTLTNFSDTGLTPETTYSYTVDAFDAFGNVSSTSVAVATTTLAVPIVPPATTTPLQELGTVVSTAGARLGGSVTVTVESTVATLNWDTISESGYVVRWGRTTNYELGTVSGGVFRKTHQTNITQLEPGTKYYFEIIGITPYGFERVLFTDSFVTDAVVAPSSVANVSAFTVAADGMDTRLSWQNPESSDFAYVRILRNPLFYPQNAYDGVLVYEGPLEKWKDLDALRARETQYYTVFVYDNMGNISSGAIAIVTRSTEGGGEGTTSIHSTSSVNMPQKPLVPILPDSGDVAILSAEEVYVLQSQLAVTFANEIFLNQDETFVVMVPKEAVFNHIKSIIVTVPDVTNTDVVTKYLLKLNPDGTQYQAAVPAMRRSGSVRLTLEVFDYELGAIRRISVPVTFGTERQDVVWPDAFIPREWNWWVVMVPGAPVCFWFILLLLRRLRREDNN